MKMLMIVFRESLEQDVMKVLKDLEVKAFTEVPAVVGAGKSSAGFPTFPLLQRNAMVLTGLPDDHAAKVIQGLRAYRDQLVQRQHGAYIPLAVFTVPCEQVV